MGISKGLKSIGKALERQGGSGDGVKYLKLADGEKVGIRFLQELDPDSPNYNDAAGLGVVAAEHSNPANFQKAAVCSADDEDKCFGCEMHRKDFKAKWGAKAKLYVNVLVKRADGTEEVAVLKQGNGPKSVTGNLIEFAIDNKSITNRPFTLKRKGSGPQDTEYVLLPQDKDESPYDVSQHELIDLSKAYRQIPYAEQEEYFLGTQSGNDEDKSSTGSESAW